jgi:hypothetical protein
LIQDQVEAGTQAIPPPLEGGDERVTAADLEGDGGGGKSVLQLADP